MVRYFGVIPIKIPNYCQSFEDFVANIKQIEEQIGKIDFVKCPSNEDKTPYMISLCEE